MSRSMTLNLAFVATILALAGCAARDPYRRTDVWRPTGSNAGNIAAMVANPHDLISGRGSPYMNAGEPALAVSHVWLDTPKPLLGSGGSGGGGSASGAGAGASGASSGGSSGTPGS